MKDTIQEEDMLIDLSKTEIEKRIVKTEQENDILKERLDSHQREVSQLKALTQIYLIKLAQVEEMSRR